VASFRIEFHPSAVDEAEGIGTRLAVPLHRRRIYANSTMRRARLSRRRTAGHDTHIRSGDISSDDSHSPCSIGPPRTPCRSWRWRIRGESPATGARTESGLERHLGTWRSLQDQLGADHARLGALRSHPRNRDRRNQWTRRWDFRCRALEHLQGIVRVYPAVRARDSNQGLRLYTSSPHVRPWKVRNRLRAPGPL
jgi:hypothetical protein